MQTTVCLYTQHFHLSLLVDWCISAVLCYVVQLLSEFDEMSQSSDDDVDDDSGKETKDDEGLNNC